jgi:hypothetical protein
MINGRKTLHKKRSRIETHPTKIQGKRKLVEKPCIKKIKDKNSSIKNTRGKKTQINTTQKKMKVNNQQKNKEKKTLCK